MPGGKNPFNQQPPGFGGGFGSGFGGFGGGGFGPNKFFWQRTKWFYAIVWVFYPNLSE